MAANPNLAIVLATASTFRAEDRTDPRFYLFATLVAGVLRFEVVARQVTGERGAVTGREFFAEMMGHFGAKVRVLEGNWDSTSGLTTNIDQMNRAAAAGLGPEEAAALTWTGMRACEFGYNQVRVIAVDPPGATGHWIGVRVEFSR